MPGQPTNAEAAAQFRRLADLLEIRGEPYYRANAYRKAAESIEHLPESLATIRERGELRKIPGVGQAIADKIVDLLDTGRIRQLVEIEQEIPPGVADLLLVPEIGPRRASLLYRNLGIDSLDALRMAIAEDKLTNAPGFGPKGAQRIAAALASMSDADDRFPLPVARRLGAEVVAELLARAPEIERIELAGSIRRCRETIGDLDIVAAAEEPAVAVERFASLPFVARIEMKGANRCRAHLEQGIAADLRVLPARNWGSLLHHFTGSKAHNVRLRDLALERGASQSEYGIQLDGRLIEFATEEEVYAFFGMPLIPPPMRENTGEIELALRGELPVVVQVSDLRADLHVHSTWSDGTASILDMARAARDRGYEYLCITDHSPAMAIVHGLGPERLIEQRAEIDAVNAELAPFRVLQGVEVDVHRDGTLDLPDDALARLDFAIASVHGGFNQPREHLTARAMAALRHPLVDVLAHPTGRVLGGRPGGDFDLDALFAEAARGGTPLEINGAVLDLRDAHARAALAAGCDLALDSDAHSVTGLADAELSVGTAQRAWCPPDRVLNARPLEDFLARLKRNRSRATGG